MHTDVIQSPGGEEGDEEERAEEGEEKEEREEKGGERERGRGKGEQAGSPRCGGRLSQDGSCGHEGIRRSVAARVPAKDSTGMGPPNCGAQGLELLGLNDARLHTRTDCTGTR